MRSSLIPITISSLAAHGPANQPSTPTLSTPHPALPSAMPPKPSPAQPSSLNLVAISRPRQDRAAALTTKRSSTAARLCSITYLLQDSVDVFFGITLVVRRMGWNGIEWDGVGWGEVGLGEELIGCGWQMDRCATHFLFLYTTHLLGFTPVLLFICER